MYPKEMNLYGDTGNVRVLQKRLEWRGIPFRTVHVSIGEPLPPRVDLLVGGGGQDASQGEIEADFMRRQKDISTLVESGTAMLMICGMYQMMGRRFVTVEGKEIKGLEILPVETIAKEGRIIGNITVSSPFVSKDVVGYENHSGRTYLDSGAHAFGNIVSGIGNNDTATVEGCVLNSVVGTYMHGPVLSKNPELADFFIVRALSHAGLDTEMVELDDTIEETARTFASNRPR